MTLHLELLTILSMLLRNTVRIAPRTSTCPTITRDFTQLHPSQVKISILIMLGIVSNSYSFIPISDKGTIIVVKHKCNTIPGFGLISDSWSTYLQFYKNTEIAISYKIFYA